MFAKLKSEGERMYFTLLNIEFFLNFPTTQRTQLESQLMSGFGINERPIYINKAVGEKLLSVENKEIIELLISNLFDVKGRIRLQDFIRHLKLQGGTIDLEENSGGTLSWVFKEGKELGCRCCEMTTPIVSYCVIGEKTSTQEEVKKE